MNSNTSIDYTDLDDITQELCRELPRRGVDYADISALARALHGCPAGDMAALCLSEHAWLMEFALVRVSLTLPAARAIANTVLRWEIGTPSEVMELPNHVSTLLADSENRECLGLSQEDAQKLVASLAAMPPLQTLAIVNAVEHAESLVEHSEGTMSWAQALRAVRLV